MQEQLRDRGLGRETNSSGSHSSDNQRRKRKTLDITKNNGTVYETNLKGAPEALHTVKNRKSVYLPAGIYGNLFSDGCSYE